MKNLKTLLLVFLFLFASCAKSIVVNFSDDTLAKGKINIMPSRSLERTSLVVNGKLLIDQKHLKKITVQNLPDGIYSYHLTCDNSKYTEKVDSEKRFDINAGEEQTFLLEVPPYSNGYWLNVGLYSIATWVSLYVFYGLD
ncbi:MAG: hypothetical protein GC192_08425 [Bacteroidetes bacterium]|nr:hypothetical protein [Bacteroidota bacterium]